MSEIGSQFADDGAEFISDTVAHTGNFFAIQATTDIVVSAITESNLTGNSLATKTIPKGAIVYFKFTSITFSSGEGFCYKSSQI